jgi:hypothetical protein
VTGEPPLFAVGTIFHVTVAFSNPAVAVAPVGAFGGVAVFTADAAAEAVPMPTALTASTVNE